MQLLSMYERIVRYLFWHEAGVLRVLIGDGGCFEVGADRTSPQTNRSRWTLRQQGGRARGDRELLVLAARPVADCNGMQQIRSVLNLIDSDKSHLSRRERVVAAARRETLI
jgi:hypothetical protein